MVLRRMSVDDSVRYNPKSEQTRENKPIIMRNKKQSEQIQPISGGGEPNTRKQKNFFKKKFKNLLKILQQEDLVSLNE